jgi:hypothetical protein
MHEARLAEDKLMPEEYQPKNAENPYQSPLVPPAGEAERSDRHLEHRIANLERQLGASSIHSTSFMRRAFTVWGHFMVAHLLFALCIGAIVLLISLLTSGL